MIEGDEADQEWVSVVMPCAGAGRGLREQLAALAAQCIDEPWELVVVDNGCSPGCLDELAKGLIELPQARVIDGRQLRGQAQARNRGLAEARGQRVLFCDADDVVDRMWVRSMAGALASADVVGGRLRYERINAPGLVAALYRQLQASELPMLYGPRPYVLSCSMGVRRRAFEAVGGFDGTLAAGEDVDVSWRLQDSGARFAFVPEAIVDYRLRTGALSRVSQQRWYGRGNALVRWKHRDEVGLPEVGELLLTLRRLATGTRFLFRRGEPRLGWLCRAAYTSAEYSALLRCHLCGQ